MDTLRKLDTGHWTGEHQLTKLNIGRYQCSVCRWTWKNKPYTDCPGVQRYEYGQWPEHLFTYSQLKAMRLKPMDREKPDGVYFIQNEPYRRYLYSKTNAVPRRTLTERQQESVKKMRETLKRKYTCSRCDYYDESHGQGKDKYHRRIRASGMCEDCERQSRITGWAYEYLHKGEFIVLDSETTGLNQDSWDDEIIELAIIHSSGKVLFSSLIQTQNPDRQDLATHIHGITQEELRSAPRFPDVWAQIEAILQKYPRVLVYNAAFDLDLMLTMCRLYGYKFPDDSRWECLMEKYAIYHGAWSDYHRSYTWQRLQTAIGYLGVQEQGVWHRATGDALAALELLKALAALHVEQPVEVVPVPPEKEEK